MAAIYISDVQLLGIKGDLTYVSKSCSWKVLNVL